LSKGNKDFLLSEDFKDFKVVKDLKDLKVLKVLKKLSKSDCLADERQRINLIIMIN